MTWIAIPLAGLTVVSTLAGGALGLRLHRELQTAIALSGGIVVAVALFDLIPEAFEAVGDEDRVMSLVGAGFVLFFVAHRYLVLHHRDDPEETQAHSRVGALSAAALAVHTFTDGLAIGLAFGLDTATGVLVLLAVISHDFADGLNAVTFILRQGGSRRSAVRWLALVAVAPLLGAALGAAVDVSEHTLGQLLALYAGIFLYIGASDLLPEAHSHNPSGLRVAVTLAGFAGDLRDHPDRGALRLRGLEALLRKLAEAAAGLFVRAKRLVVRICRVGRDLVRDGPHLAGDCLAVCRVGEQRVDPVLGAVVGIEVALHEQLAEEDADADVRERPEGEEPVRRADEPAELRVLVLDARDDAADRLVDERDPEVLRPRQARRVYGRA